MVLPTGAIAVEREPALGVQHGRRDRTERVEEHLRDEEPQQVGRELLLLGGDRRIVDAGGEELGDPRCGQRCPAIVTTPSPTHASESSPPATSSARR